MRIREPSEPDRTIRGERGMPFELRSAPERSRRKRRPSPAEACRNIRGDIDSRRRSAPPFALLAVGLFLVAIPSTVGAACVVAACGGSSKNEEAAGRAATFRSAMAIHDGIATQRSEPPRREIQPFWLWLSRAFALLAAVALVPLVVSRGCQDRDRPEPRRSIAFALGVLVLATASDAVLPALGGRISARRDEALLREAEWQWRLDMAEAAALDDTPAERAALRAARRYERATRPR